MGPLLKLLNQHHTLRQKEISELVSMECLKHSLSHSQSSVIIKQRLEEHHHCNEVERGEIGSIPASTTNTGYAVCSEELSGAYPAQAPTS